MATGPPFAETLGMSLCSVNSTRIASLSFDAVIAVPRPRVLLAATLMIAVSWSTPARADASQDSAVRVDGFVNISSANGRTLVEPGVDINIAIRPNVGAGVQLSGGSASILTGRRSGFNVAPNVEIFRRWSKFHVFARGGVPMQIRTGGRLESSNSVAVFAGGGVRFRTCGKDEPFDALAAALPNCVSVGYEFRAQYNMLGNWLMSPAILPGNTAILSSVIMFGIEY